MAKLTLEQALFRQQTVLLVEDEEFSRTMVGKMLEAVGFGRVVLAESGKQAIDILSHGSVTMVVTDFRMQGMNGLQLLKAIRSGKTKAPRNLPCALLTSHAERRLVAFAIVLDVDTFLVKPVSHKILSKHLSYCLQQRLEPMEVSAYENVDVDTAAPHLAMPEEEPPVAQPDEGPAPEGWSRLGAKGSEKDEPEGAPAKRGGTGDGKPSIAPLSPSRAASSSGSAPRLASSSAINPCSNGEKQVALSDVPENAILSRNVTGSGGTLLLAAGTRFKSRYARRLEELRGIEGSIGQVWICQ